MISWSRFEQAERKWRGFALGRGAHLLFWPGVVVFLAALVAPADVSSMLIRRVCLGLFSALAVLMASSFALTAAVELRRREFAAGIWMMLWTSLLCWLGGTVAVSAVR
jgi:hypothetical protein